MAWGPAGGVHCIGGHQRMWADRFSWSYPKSYDTPPTSPSIGGTLFWSQKGPNFSAPAVGQMKAFIQCFPLTNPCIFKIFRLQRANEHNDIRCTALANRVIGCVADEKFTFSCRSNTVFPSQNDAQMPNFSSPPAGGEWSWPENDQDLVNPYETVLGIVIRVLRSHCKFCIFKFLTKK